MTTITLAFTETPTTWPDVALFALFALLMGFCFYHFIKADQ